MSLFLTKVIELLKSRFDPQITIYGLVLNSQNEMISLLSALGCTTNAWYQTLHPLQTKEDGWCGLSYKPEKQTDLSSEIDCPKNYETN